MNRESTSDLTEDANREGEQMPLTAYDPMVLTIAGTENRLNREPTSKPTEYENVRRQDGIAAIIPQYPFTRIYKNTTNCLATSDEPREKRFSMAIADPWWKERQPPPFWRLEVTCGGTGQEKLADRSEECRRN